MTGFDPAKRRHLLETSRIAAEAATRREDYLPNAVGNAARAGMQVCIYAWLVGLREEVAPILAKYRDWLADSIARDERFGRPAEYFAAVRQEAYGIACWMLDGTADPAPYRASLPLYERTWTIAADGNPLPIAEVMRDYAGDYLRNCVLARRPEQGSLVWSRLGGNPQVAAARIVGEAELGARLCQVGWGDGPPDEETLAAAGGVLGARIGDWLDAGEALTVALWLKAVFFLGGVTTTPEQTLLQAYRLMPGVTPVPDQTRPFDPGEAIARADALSRDVPAEPPADSRARAAARAKLTGALTAIERVLATIPAGADRVPAEAFHSAEGIAVFRAEPGRFRRERLEAVRDTWRAILAEYGSGEETPVEMAARSGRALALAGTVAELARPLLQRLTSDPAGFLDAVRPRPDDAARAFMPEAAEAASAAYEAIWRAQRAPRPEPGQTDLHVVAAPAGLLDADNPLSAVFPKGYRTIAHLLRPHRVWLRWQHVRPGEKDGLMLDGLVWLDDHWAWFPRPYRVLGDALRRQPHS